MNYASAGDRFVAFLLDAVVIWVLNFLLLIPVAALTGGKGSPLGLGVIALVSYLIIPIGYWVVFQHKMGQTLGKKVLKIKVVNASGQTPSMGIFFLREIVGKIVSGIILGIGYLMIFWDGKKQALHDKIASTFVVKI